MKTPQNIVVGVDRSAASRNALREAARIACWDRATLHVIEVIPDGVLEVYWGGVEATPEETQEKYRAELVELVKSVIETLPEIEITNVTGHPYLELCKKVEAADADLLVLGSQGWSSEDDHVGMFASQAVRNSKVPVLLVRRDQSEPFKRVVACVDFSERSVEVVEAAAEIARQDGSELEIVHVLSYPWLRDPSIGYYVELGELVDRAYGEPYEEAAKERMATLAGMVGGIPERLLSTHVIEHGNPGWGVVEYLSDSGADLAVVGDRGKGGFRKLLLGTTAERIIHHAHCSVLTIKTVGGGRQQMRP